MVMDEESVRNIVMDEELLQNVAMFEKLVKNCNPVTESCWKNLLKEQHRYHCFRNSMQRFIP